MLTCARRAEVCSDFTVCSFVQRWVANANHKIKCHNTFREQGVWHRYWSTARRFCLGLHLHFQAGWHLWLPVFTNKKSNSDLPKSTALSFSCLATIRALFRMAWVQNTFFFWGIFMKNHGQIIFKTHVFQNSSWIKAMLQNGFNSFQKTLDF